MSDQNEYIVTVKKSTNWRDVHNDLITDTSSNDAVDSNIIPDRACECINERTINNRNTHYNLTDDEAKKLQQDNRILAVEKLSDIPEPRPFAVQTGDFNKTSSQSGQQDNWGLARHIKETNYYSNSTSHQSGYNYDYVLDGTGVDMVVIDTGIQADHPEWQDADGASRLQQIDWFAESGVPGTQPVNFYTDVNGHGTHCIGTMAGKYFGWAKNARIYSITLYGNSGNNISWNNTVDCLIGWHNNKPIDPTTGVKRPTVVNMSFGYAWFINTTTSPDQVVAGPFNASITGGNYRGTAHTDTDRTNLTQYGCVGSFRPDYGPGYYMFGRKFASIDADVEQLINNGIHVCIAAGNNYQKIDKAGGLDYNNYITFDYGATTYYAYYHRSGSPSVYEGGNTLETSNAGISVGDDNEGFNVGALDNTALLDGVEYKDRKVGFSESGPAVDIYAAGDQIISAQPTSMGSTYYWNSSFKQAKYSGTSMAAPQMCGMVGCLLQAHPDWTPGQVKGYFLDNAKAEMVDTGNNDDFTTSYTIHGGNNRIAYFPLNGQRPYSIG